MGIKRSNNAFRSWILFSYIYSSVSYRGQVAQANLFALLLVNKLSDILTSSELKFKTDIIILKYPVTLLTIDKMQQRRSVLQGEKKKF